MPGRVALIQRGTCAFHDKALNAQTAGASAVVVFNEGQPGRTDAIIGTLGTPDFHIPVIGTTFAIGQELHTQIGTGAVVVHVKTSTQSEIRQTANVIADTPWGDPNRIIVQGSHLDSVTARPGHQRQRLGLGLQPRVGDPGDEEPDQDDEQDPLRVVGRRGVQPPGLPVLRRQPVRRGVREDHARTSTST